MNLILGNEPLISEIRILRWLNIFLSYFKVCLLCQLPLSPIYLLCQKCWTAQENFYRANCDQINDIRIFSLRKWYVSDLFLSDIIISLKGRANYHAWKIIAEKFVFLHSNQFERKNTVIIPAGSADYKIDHAYLFGFHLSQILEVPFMPMLQLKQHGTKQKMLNLHDRQLREFVWSGASLSSKNVLFVDDVLSSGSTALSAQKAIGKHRKFQVLVFAKRENLGTSH